MAKGTNGRGPARPVARPPFVSAQGPGSLASVPALLNAGLQHHQAGRLAAAEPLYRQALAIDPNNADGLNLLGVLAHQVGRHDAAVELIGRAIRVHGREPSFHHNLGAALLALGRHEDMAQCYRAAIALKPDYAEAYFNLGVALQALGRLDEAAKAYRGAIGLQPNNPLAHAHMGAVLKDQGRLAEAEGCLRKVVALQPDNAQAHNNLGVVLEALDRASDAAISYRRAVDLAPDFAAAHYNLAGVLRLLDQLDEAKSRYERAIALTPDYAEAHNNLGAVLQTLERPEEAQASFERAIALNPRYAEAHRNLGWALRVAGRPEAASEAYRQATELEPGDADLQFNLGMTLQLAGRAREAAAAFEQAVALKPDYVDADSNRLLSLLYTDIAEADLLAEHRRWDQHHGGGAGAPNMTFANSREPDRRLRIGYVSADFNFHPVGIYLTQVVAAQDRSALEIFCYYNGKSEDEFTGLLRAKADHWRGVADISDEDAEAMIRRDEIDILIDLSGHTGGHRLTLLARRPAPVQASWLGYPGTTGLSAMDYLVMDGAAVPPGCERYCSEAVVRLPHSRFCYTAPSYAPDVVDPAVRDGQPITFGCFNNLAKITPRVVELWAKVLRAVPGSRLVLKWKTLEDALTRRRLGQAFGQLGVAADRLEFRAATPHVQMLAEYGGIDVALDPFPFCGGLTSCEALWMGVPVVTLPGERPVSRQTLGFLSLLGLDDLAAESEADYIHIATTLAANAQRRADLRRTLRPRMAASPLCDPNRFAPALDWALREMWRRWCAGEPAATFDVASLDGPNR